ncbi:MAG: CHAT domain-containing protein [Magnetococcales bacterium]|nr:CHAT domain-containing protein [Magnetococcales bacterium]
MAHRLFTLMLLIAVVTLPATGWGEDEAAMVDVDEVIRQVEEMVPRAASHQAAGHYVEAGVALGEALALAKTTPSPLDNVYVLIALSDFHLAIGQRDQAMADIEEGLTLIGDESQPLLHARLLNNRGNVHVVSYRFEKAEQDYRQALAQAETAGNGAMVADLLANLTQALFQSGRHTDAAAILEKAVEATRHLPKDQHTAFGMVSLGKLAFTLKLQEQTLSSRLILTALTLFKSAVTIAKPLNDARILSYAYGYQGRLYEYEKRFKEAEHLTKKAIFYAQSVSAAEILYQWQWQSARLAQAQGRSTQAITALRTSVATLSIVRPDLYRGLRNAPDSFRDLIGPIYYQLADLLLQKANTVEDPALQKGLRIEARNTIEALKSAEIQDLFQDECVAALKAKETSLDTVAADTAIFYPILLADRVELLLTLADGLHRFSVPIGKATVEGEVQQLRVKLEDVASDAYLPHAQRLYQWLITPMLDTLKEQKVDTLVVVPDGALRTIPLGALQSGDTFLAQQFALATTPGLRLTDPKALPRTDVRILAGGLSEAVQGFSALPNVPKELETIRTIFPSDVLLNEQYTVDEIVRSLSKTSYPIVHIASHGQFDRDPAKTFLLAYDDKLTMNTLELMIGHGRFREQPVELLTLSACQTAVGDDRAALGLAGVAIKAGARSALATLWFIDDAATATLVAEFYRQLQNPKLSKADALRNAQSLLIKDPRMQHPGFWAAFILIGNWL